MSNDPVENFRRLKAQRRAEQISGQAWDTMTPDEQTAAVMGLTPDQYERAMPHIVAALSDAYDIAYAAGLLRALDIVRNSVSFPTAEAAIQRVIDNRPDTGYPTPTGGL